MEQLKFGIFPYPPYLYSNDKSDLSGYLSAHYKTINYYLLEKFNITFVNIAPRAGAHCDQRGNCYGALKDLQLGRVDTSNYYGTYTLSSVPINLTLTSPVGESKCYLFYKPDVRRDIKSEYFFEFVQYFEPTFWFLLISLVISFFILCKYLQVYRLTSWWQLIWTLIGTTLGQFTVQPVGRLSLRCFYMIVFSGFLLLGSIFSASMQTGLKATFDFVKLNSLNDVIEQNYTAMVIDTVTCRTLFDSSSTLKNVKQISQQLILIDATNKGPYELFQITTTPGKTIVDENLQYLRMKHFSCWFNRQKELASPIYISKHSVFKVIDIGVHYSGVNRKTDRLIKRVSYNAFEMGLSDNHQVRKLGLFSDFNDKKSATCMDNQVLDDSIITSPITLDYLMKPVILLYNCYFIVFIVFILGHWSACPYNYNDDNDIDDGDDEMN